jgi:hypothetical protein
MYERRGIFARESNNALSSKSLRFLAEQITKHEEHRRDVAMPAAPGASFIMMEPEPPKEK